MKKNKDLILAVIILCAFALVSGALLGLFAQITLITDEEKDQRMIAKLQEIELDNLEPDYKKVVDCKPDKNIQGFFADEKLKVYAIMATGINGYKDKVPMYVIIKDDKIIALKQGLIKETPGVSDTAFSDDYFERFYESVYDRMFDIETKVDTATGATRSSKAVISSIKNAVRYYKEYKGTN